MQKTKWILAFVAIALIISLPCYAQPIIDKVKPRCVAPGEKIRILGTGFGDVQDDSVVHIGRKSYDSTSPRVKLWTDTKIRIKIPFVNKDSEWFIHGDGEYRKRKVWVTVGGQDSNRKRFRVCRPVEPESCMDNSACGPGVYCAKPADDCEGPGQCTPMPETCPLTYAPVCGCDSVTYTNACTAAMNGVNVAYEGECFVPIPSIEEYSYSACLPPPPGGEGAQGPYCDNADEIVAVVDGDSIHVTHSNATYNCCPDDIQVLLSVDGNVLWLTETDILTVPCTCLCCFNVESTVVGLSPGSYTIQYCWDDFETGSECYTENIIVP